MELKKVQRNAGTLKKLQDSRETVSKLIEDLRSNHNSRYTSVAVTALETAGHALEDRMVELGMVKEFKEGNE